MEQRPYGSTGLRVSALGLGAAQVGDAELTDREAEALLLGTLDAGITLIDTARGYGHSEARIGRFLAGRRDRFVLSTKVGYSVEGHEDWTPGCVRAGIERARTLMRTDALDIVHLHSCTADVLHGAGVAEALAEAKADGHVRAIAYSGDDAALAAALGFDAFDGFQASLNICDQKILDTALPAIRSRNAGFIAKRPIANAPWRHGARPEGAYVEPYWERFRAMGFGNDPDADVLDGLDWAEVALRFTAFTPGVSSCIVGTSQVKHVAANIAAIERGPLPAALVADIRARFRAHDDQWVGQV